MPLYIRHFESINKGTISQKKTVDAQCSRGTFRVMQGVNRLINAFEFKVNGRSLKLRLKVYTANPCHWNSYNGVYLWFSLYFITKPNLQIFAAEDSDWNNYQASRPRSYNLIEHINHCRRHTKEEWNSSIMKTRELQAHSMYEQTHTNPSLPPPAPPTVPQQCPNSVHCPLHSSSHN